MGGSHGRDVCSSIFGVSSENGQGGHAGPVRVLVTGASGLLGRQIMKELANGPWEVRGLFASRAREGLVCCNLLHDGQIEAQFKEFQPDVVIHSAAERRPDVVFKKPEVAQKMNIEVTSNIAEACRRHNAWLIFLSTDYVFDGLEPPYKTDAEPHPLSLYGEQKLLGEAICREKSPLSAVLRVPLLYGPMEHLKESGVTSMYEELLKGLAKADHLQRRYPTYTCDVARILGKMLDVQFGGTQKLSGIYHWQTNEAFTKYDMVQVIASIMDIDTTDIEASTAPSRFPSPPDSRLDCSRIEEELGIVAAEYRTPFREALGWCLTSFENAKGDDKPQPPPPTPSAAKRSIGKKERESLLDALGASEELSHSAALATNAKGEIDAKDFQHILGTPTCK